MYSTRKHNNWNTASATYVRTYIRSTSVHRKATNKFTSRHMLGTSKRIRMYSMYTCTARLTYLCRYSMDIHTVHTWYNKVQHRDVDITPSLPSTTVLLNTPPPALALCNEAD